MMQLTIEKLDKDLDGIVYKDNIAIKVPFCKVGDIVDILDIDYTNKTPVATKFNLNKDSHQSPLCEYFYKCGGCKLQHFSKQEYTEIKLQLVKDSFKKANFTYKINNNNFYNHLDEPKHHRRRVEFSVDKSIVGFKGYKTNQVIQIKSCPLLTNKLNLALDEFSNIVNKYNNVLQIISIHLTQIDDYIDVLLVSCKKNDLNVVKLLQQIFQISYIARIYWKYKNLIEPIVVKHNLQLSYGSYKVNYHINTFLQAEEFGEKLIVNFILKYLFNSEKILDLFCGYGGYSLSLLSSKTKLIKCIDIESKAIESLSKINNKIINACVQDLFKKPILAEDINDYDAIIINPPRSGAFLQIQEIAKSKIKKIAMVYCSLTSLTRDLTYLLQNNDKYYIVDIIFVDQFVFTHHLEIIVIVEKS